MADNQESRLDISSYLCIIRTMITRGRQPTANRTKRAQIERAVAEILAQITRRGFFGTASLEMAVQDGTIQHIRQTVERIDK